MKGKTWVIAFLAFLAVGCGVYMGVCYSANPLGYFTVEKGLNYFYTPDNCRVIKTNYVLKHKDEFDAYVVGGSKSGLLDVKQLEEFTGLRYYNMFYNVGNFSDYLAFTRFLIEKAGAKEILLHLSSFEPVAYSREDLGTNMEKPAAVTGGKLDVMLEKLKYLTMNVDTVRKSFRKNRKRNLLDANPLDTGMRNRRDLALRWAVDPEKEAGKLIRDLDEELPLLFAEDAEWETPTYRQNLDALREIKKLCDDAGVNLVVMVGASFVGERFRYECSGYYNYLAQIVNIVGEVWDFSSYHPINMNVYNFINTKHYDRDVALRMLDIMYGKDANEDGFGILLTKDNVHEYLAQRRDDYNRLKEEYETTGTLQLPGMDDPSYLPWTYPEEWQMPEDLSDLELLTEGDTEAEES